MLVFTPGAEVHVGPEDDPIRGTVIQISIRSGARAPKDYGPRPLHVVYEVQWWEGRDAKSGWFSDVRLLDDTNAGNTMELSPTP